ncbi:serine hydrolase [Sphaerisporangium sp. NBC_01403]|uniref:serine hydrolase n=1 Tax=Sphaerisporangium sp. NBC_01403 TaxID=2903599 RepID=UPI003243A5BF
MSLTTRSTRSTRVLSATLAIAALALTACAPGEQSTATSALTPAPSGSALTPAPSGSPAKTVDIPGTPVGGQLRWFLDVVGRPPIADDELAEHLSAEFLKEVPPAQFNKTLEGLAGLKLDELTGVQPTAIVGLISLPSGRLKLSISVDASGKINVLRLSPVASPSPTPASWSDIDKRLRAVAPQSGFLAAEVTPGGGCRPVHALAPGEPRPLGSMFKTYVLGAVAQRVREGKLSWDDKLTITPELKSLPGGELQDRPDGSTVSVREAAKLMISISDNTGADLLLDKVGRRAVEATNAAWSDHAKRNVPFLTTRELFVLKGADYPRLTKEYLALDSKGRRAYLDRTVAKVPLSRVTSWQAPRELDTVEWLGSPSDMCRAFAGLSGFGDREVSEVMSGDAGLGLPREDWPLVWYKGGSEPGVLTMGFLARSAKGKTYVVTTLTSDPSAPFNEDAITQESLALIRGAFALL